MMKIVFLLFENLTVLDVVGPYEVLSRIPGAECFFVGIDKSTYADSHGLKLVADYSIDEIHQADILLIPGGFGIDKLLTNEKLISWIQKTDNTTTWTTSVCAGALLLAQAGLLHGKHCTTHWKRKKQLRAYGNDILIPEHSERYVRDGKLITSSGVSAGIDMALYLTAEVAGETTAQTIQLSIEYDPNPPFDCGIPEKAPHEIIEKL